MDNLGLLAGLIALLSATPYIYGIFRKGIKPERASWFVWTTILTISFIAQYSAGARDSLWFTLGDLVACAVVFIISLRRGVGGFTKFDITCVSLAILGIFAWLVLGTPLAAILGAIFADIMGSLPTIRKGYLEPDTEGASWFAIHVGAGILALLAANTTDFIILIAPAYIALANGVIVAAILLGRKRMRRMHELG